MKKVVVVAAVAWVAGVAAAVSAEGEKKESSCGDAGGGEDKEAPFGEGDDDDDMVDRSPSFQESNPRNNCCFCGNPDLLAIAEFGRPLPASWQII